MSIKLRNWTSEFEDDGDNIGVVTPWQYPALNLPPVTPTDLERVCAAIAAGGPWRADHARPEPWVGVPIARALGRDLLDKRVKSAVAKLIKDWLSVGKLKVVKGRDKHRELKTYVEVAGVE